MEIPVIFNHELNLTEHWDIMEVAFLESLELYRNAGYYARNKTRGFYSYDKTLCDVVV